MLLCRGGHATFLTKIPLCVLGSEQLSLGFVKTIEKEKKNGVRSKYELDFIKGGG